MAGQYTRRKAQSVVRGEKVYCGKHRLRYTPWESVNGKMTRYGCPACENEARIAERGRAGQVPNG